MVVQLKNNLCNVNTLSETDLELLSNIDTNSHADTRGKEFLKQLKKVSGRLVVDRKFQQESC